MWRWLLLAFLVFASMVSDVSTQSIMSRKKPGISCGDDECVTNSMCLGQNNPECVCNQHYVGMGNFQCHKNKTDQIRFQLIGDKFWPSNTKDTKEYSLPRGFLWVYRLLQVQTDGKKGFDKCNIQVNGIQQVVKGKTSLKGLELRLSTVTFKGVETKVTVRLVGSCVNGIVRYDMLCRNDSVLASLAASFDGSGSGDGGVVRFSTLSDDEDLAPSKKPWLPCLTFDMGNGVTRKADEDSDSFGVIDLKNQCGVTVRLKGASKGTSKDDGGMIVTIDKNNDPVFQDPVHHLNHCPDSSQWPCHDPVVNPDPMTYNRRLFVFVLTYGVKDDTKIAGDVSELIPETIDSYHTLCPTRNDSAVSKCSTLLSPGIIRCLEGNHFTGVSAKAWKIGKLCLGIMCGDLKSLCYSIYKDLHPGCKDKWPSVQAKLLCPDRPSKP